MHNIQKGNKWDDQEDKAVIKLVDKYGLKNWAKISQELTRTIRHKSKSGKQCRERWYNHLSPGVIKKSWTQAEEEIIFEYHKIYGNKWTSIAEKLPGRTQNSIKNHFYSIIRRSLRRMSKLAGFKNSTLQMRQIKPAILSHIFNMMQGQSKQGQIINPQIVNMSSENASTFTPKQFTCALMQLVRYKTVRKQKKQAYLKKYMKIIQYMSAINQNYNEQKYSKAQKRKQLKLLKNFDGAISQFQSSQQSFKKQEQKYKKPSKRVQKPIDKFKQQQCRRSNRQQCGMIKKQQTFHTIKTQFDVKKYLTKQSQILPNQQSMESDCQISVKYEQQSLLNQFSLQLDANEFNMEQVYLSPSFINTPLALTPIHFDAMLRQPPKQFQAINNEECNSVLAMLKSRIQRNISGDTSRRDHYCPTLFLSPSSAFKQYN